MSLANTREPLFADGWLVEHDYEEETLGVLKMGKESEVRLVARSGQGRTSYIAEKRFKSKGFRSFRNDAVYRATWFTGPGEARAQRAVRDKTRRGRQMLEAAWYGHEWNELRHLYTAGVTVPPPVEEILPTKLPSRTFHWSSLNAPTKGSHDEAMDGGYRMGFIGDPPVASPRLASLRLSPEHAERVWRELLHEIWLMLRAERVHGDLSAYNVLYWRERPVIIDLSQTVDLVTHAGARAILRRDLEHLATYFERQGIDAEVDQAWRLIDADRALEGRR
ncbi:MAG TPA: RIO1 family regulatory kinase/ATPase [Candidatus Limnocylindria bacterium]